MQNLARIFQVQQQRPEAVILVVTYGVVNGQPAMLGLDRGCVYTEFASLSIVLLFEEELRFSESEQVFC